jgi:hypothetical protein
MWATQCRICGRDICINKYDDPICDECEFEETENEDIDEAK